MAVADVSAGGYVLRAAGSWAQGTVRRFVCPACGAAVMIADAETMGVQAVLAVIGSAIWFLILFFGLLPAFGGAGKEDLIWLASVTLATAAVFLWPATALFRNWRTRRANPMVAGG